MKLDLSLGLVLEKLYLLAGLRGMPLYHPSKICQCKIPFCFGLIWSHWGGIAPTIPVCMSAVFMPHKCLFKFGYSLIQAVIQLLCVLRCSCFPVQNIIYFSVILVYWYISGLYYFLQATHSDVLKLLIIFEF